MFNWLSRRFSKLSLRGDLHAFFRTFSNLPKNKQVFAGSLLLLTLLNPGQNALQTLVVHPGPPRIRPVSVDLPSPDPHPRPLGQNPPRVSAQAVIVQDADSRVVMYQRNPDTTLMPASTTKIMTALVAMDVYPNLNQVLEVSNVDRAIGHTMELEYGESLTVGSLLYGLLVESGNDAAYTLAANYLGGYDAFVSLMNDKARALHLDHTTYKNVSGVEQLGHTTTARDLATLAAHAMESELFASIVQTKSRVVTDITGTKSHPLENTNELLGEVEGLRGVKTGWTLNAGECLVTLTERKGRRVIAVVLGSQDRFGDSRRLIEWAFANHSWETPTLP